jgi:hypothetical protein
MTRIPVKMWPPACQGNEKKVSGGWGLLACLGLTLALAGADIPTSPEPEQGILLWVNEYPISATQLSHAERRLSGEHSGGVSESERRVVLELLIDEELLLQRAESLGIPDSAPGVRKAIVQAAISEIVEDFLRRPFDEPMLEQFYVHHRAVFEHPGRRAIAALRFDKLSAARRAADAYANGSRWVDLAAMPQAQPVRYLPGSPLPAHVLRRYLGPTLANVALALRPGEISDPVESAGSAYLIKLITVDAPFVPAFSEILPDVRAEYLSRGRETALADKLALLWRRADIRFNPQVVGKLPISDKDLPLQPSVAKVDVPAGQNTEWLVQ